MGRSRSGRRGARRWIDCAASGSTADRGANWLCRARGSAQCPLGGRSSRRTQTARRRQCGRSGSLLSARRSRSPKAAGAVRLDQDEQRHHEACDDIYNLSPVALDRTAPLGEPPCAVDVAWRAAESAEVDPWPIRRGDPSEGIQAPSPKSLLQSPRLAVSRIGRRQAPPVRGNQELGRIGREWP